MRIFKTFISLLYVIFFVNIAYSQNIERPKLVVGIIVDQMRFDYLYRFNSLYGEDGFNRLMNGGSNFTFAHFNYDLTSTAMGHASIYTGTTPFYHGIIGNDIFIRNIHKMVFCIKDSSVKSVGSNDDEGQKSPRNLFSTTITDQLKLASNGLSKVISISLKDRGAVLPGGHFPNGAFWYDEETGDFITSSYYMNSLPAWITDFNERKLVKQYLSENWELSFPSGIYNLCTSDESKYEYDLFNEGDTSFPHSFGNLTEAGRYAHLGDTPSGNQILVELAKAALINENLGNGNQTDFLAISFSAPDHVGHGYGIFSYELMDMYIKLDNQLAELLKILDAHVGSGNYLLFLTADHAAMETPAYMLDHNLPAGALVLKRLTDSLHTFSKKVFGDEKIIENLSNRQIYLNRDLISKMNLDFHNVEKETADFLRNSFPEITSIFTRDFLETQTASREPTNFILNGFHPNLSGDLAYNMHPGFLNNILEKGTTHGSSYNYDTHVPMIFYGWHIPVQTENTPVYIVDIAATIADLLKIIEPNACIGIPLIK
ncbi:MAG: alkaline phosphatase PafA [bacterium]